MEENKRKMEVAQMKLVCFVHFYILLTTNYFLLPCYKLHNESELTGQVVILICFNQFYAMSKCCLLVYDNPTKDILYETQNHFKWDASIYFLVSYTMFCHSFQILSS